MIGKSNIADCDENCKYEGLYEMYKNAHDDVRNELISQINVMVPLLFFLTCITAVCPLCCMITGKYNNDINRNLTIVIIVTIAMDLISFALILPTIVKGKRFLKECKISLSNIAANKIAEHVYRIQSIEDIKNENIFTDEGRLNKRESILHCIDDSGNTMDVYIDPNKSCWFDENDNNILSTGVDPDEKLLERHYAYGELGVDGLRFWFISHKNIYKTYDFMLITGKQGKFWFDLMNKE